MASPRRRKSRKQPTQQEPTASSASTNESAVVGPTMVIRAMADGAAKGRGDVRKNCRKGLLAYGAAAEGTLKEYASAEHFSPNEQSELTSLAAEASGRPTSASLGEVAAAALQAMIRGTDERLACIGASRWRVFGRRRSTTYWTRPCGTVDSRRNFCVSCGQRRQRGRDRRLNLHLRCRCYAFRPIQKWNRSPGGSPMSTSHLTGSIRRVGFLFRLLDSSGLRLHRAMRRTAMGGAAELQPSNRSRFKTQSFGGGAAAFCRLRLFRFLQIARSAIWELESNCVSWSMAIASDVLAWMAVLLPDLAR